MTRAIVISKYNISGNKRTFGLLTDFPHSSGVDMVNDITGRDGSKSFGSTTIVVVEVEASDAVLTSIGAHANYIVLATDSNAVPTWSGLDNLISTAARNKINTYLTNNGYVLRVTTSQTYRQALDLLLEEIRA